MTNNRFALNKAFCLVLIIFKISIISSYAQNLHLEQGKIANDTIVKFNADPDLGFYYPYFMRLPKGMVIDAELFLLVETNNSGVNDSLAFHEKETYLEVIKNSLGSSLCRKLKIPFLVPVFPRPKKKENLYTHALDRDAVLIKKGEMKRLDEQLIAMIKHAKSQLRKMNVLINDKILLNGFSASGTFANRFTLLHPDMVAGVACGGINGIPILPVKNIESCNLIYPLGLYDFEKIFSDTVKLTAYKRVPQFIYMGAKDNNDAVLFDDAYSKKERKIVYKCIGRTMQPDRWLKCQEIYKNNATNATFRTYPNIGHETNKEVFTDVSNFFLNIIQSYK